MKLLPIYYQKLVNTKSIDGFILVQLMITGVIISIVTLCILQYLSYLYLWNHKIREDIAVMEDGRYTRIHIAGRVKHNSRNILIQGPPGTGKSQSLTAILVNALENHKKTIVVCEKRTALDRFSATVSWLQPVLQSEKRLQDGVSVLFE